MNKKKAIIIGVSVLVGTVVLLFGVFLFVLWMADRADQYSRGEI